MNVFFSVGSPSNTRQRQFSDAVRQFLGREGLSPLTPGYNFNPNKQPLRAVEDCMKSCSGVVVLAFERIHIDTGTERRGGSNPLPADGQNLPTVWNQVEGAMGYALGLPLLVLVEKGLRADALLENKYDWNVQSIDLKPAALTTPEFRGVFDDWKSKVEGRSKHARTGPDNPGDMTAGELFAFLAKLKTGHLWAVICAVATIAFGIGSAGFALGKISARQDVATVAADSATVPPSVAPAKSRAGGE